MPGALHVAMPAAAAPGLDLRPSASITSSLPSTSAKPAYEHLPRSYAAGSGPSSLRSRCDSQYFSSLPSPNASASSLYAASPSSSPVVDEGVPDWKLARKLAVRRSWPAAVCSRFSYSSAPTRPAPPSTISARRWSAVFCDAIAQQRAARRRLCSRGQQQRSAAAAGRGGAGGQLLNCESGRGSGCCSVVPQRRGHARSSALADRNSPAVKVVCRALASTLQRQLKRPHRPCFVCLQRDAQTTSCSTTCTRNRPPTPTAF